MTTVSSSFLDHKIFLKTILLAQAKTLPVGLGSTTVAANDLTGLSDLLASTNHVLQVTLLHLFKSDGPPTQPEAKRRSMKSPKLLVHNNSLLGSRTQYTRLYQYFISMFRS